MKKTDLYTEMYNNAQVPFRQLNNFHIAERSEHKRKDIAIIATAQRTMGGDYYRRCTFNIAASAFPSIFCKFSWITKE